MKFDKSTGPVCVICNRQMRRRKIWCRWDRVKCKCGMIAEFVDYDNMPAWLAIGDREKAKKWVKENPL